MKNKILYIAVASVGLMSASCSMDLEPIGSIIDTKGLESYSDVYGFRNSLYIASRSLNTGAFYPYAEIQADMFNGITMNGNRGGTIANGNISSADSDFENYYAALYTYINYTNYMLEHAPAVQETYAAENETETAELVASYIAEAHFFRGYFYAVLFDRYSPLYTSERANMPYGACLVTEYYPTAERSKYPPRSTMDETIAFIKDEFDQALTGLLHYESLGNQENLEPMACYISSNAVKAMQARFALWIGDYDTAYTKAMEVINSGLYPLAGSASLDAGKKWADVVAEYQNMWKYDNASEIIYMPYESTSELSGAYGSTWISTESDRADYIPTPSCIAMFKEAGGAALLGYNDMRYEVFLEERELATGGYGDVKTMNFVKWPGNPDLQPTSAVNLMNKAKVFRTSELYLIAAESALQKGNTSEANTLMNTFLKYRVRNYKEETYSTNDLIDLVRSQRAKELIGEGFRLSDLRRWKMGFTRANEGSYDNSTVDKIIVASSLLVTYTTDDYRYTWPIPASEFTMNPQLTTAMQNPGYN